MEELRNKSISRSPDRHRDSTHSGYQTEQPGTRMRQSNPYDRIDQQPYDYNTQYQKPMRGSQQVNLQMSYPESKGAASYGTEP